MIKRTVYFIYYLKKLDWAKLTKFMSFVRAEHGMSKFNQWRAIIAASFKYNISILEYYQFSFYKNNLDAKKSYAGTGYMYEYQKIMNPKESREVLNDKLLFLKKYANFIEHSFVSKEDFKNESTITEFLEKSSQKVVLKHSTGQCGEGIVVLETAGQTAQSLKEALDTSENDFVEEFIEQHPDLNALSDAGLNTIRIITQLTTSNEVDLLGARLRLTVNSPVDNLAAGNIAAPIDSATGIVNGVAVYSDITKAPERTHPISKKPIVGFQVPFWQASVDLVKQAALQHPENRSIGWDVAITSTGPELLEGNHDWCKLLWQLPAQQGLKPLLETYKMTI